MPTDDDYLHIYVNVYRNGTEGKRKRIKLKNYTLYLIHCSRVIVGLAAIKTIVILIVRSK